MSFIKQTALSLGFDACGIAKADQLSDDAVFLQSWLADGKHGTMGYLARNFEKRTDPRQLVPGCKSVVVVLLNYYPQQMQHSTAPKIAKYAYSTVDYHVVMKEKLQLLEQAIVTHYGAECVTPDYQHLFVDSAPVLERRWAERAGLGWIGRHTQLIHPGLGSYTFIGVLMLNMETDYDSPIRPRCGSCTRCIDACPTGALVNGSIDARRCISYLTIESKNEIADEFKLKLSGCVLGCDICADVCPWNAKWARPTIRHELQPASAIISWNKTDWDKLNETNFRQNFSQSAIKRAGFPKLKRNIGIINDSDNLDA